MITPTQMYWLVKLDDMRHALKCIMSLPILLAIVFGCVIFAFFLANIDMDREEAMKARSSIRRGLVWCVSMVVMAITLQTVIAFIPSTKQMAAIIVVPKIANSEKVQAVGNQLYDLAVEWMNELKPGKGEVVNEARD